MREDPHQDEELQELQEGEPVHNDALFSESSCRCIPLFWSSCQTQMALQENITSKKKFKNLIICLTRAIAIALTVDTSLEEQRIHSSREDSLTQLNGRGLFEKVAHIEIRQQLT